VSCEQGVLVRGHAGLAISEPSRARAAVRNTPAFMWEGSGRGTTRAEDAPGTPTQSHTSPSILVYEDYVVDLEGVLGDVVARLGEDVGLRELGGLL